jgi:hypothetical protein
VILDPFFPYYGSCWSMARLYPRPRHDRVIEPFAGSACYSLHHPEREVVLIERDPVIAELWRWLLRVSPEEVLALPDLEPGQEVSHLEVRPEAQSLIGFWINPGNSYPGHRKSAWTVKHASRRRGSGERRYWDRRARHRIARQLEAIRHWTVVEGDGPAQTIHGAATWFVDPPYQGRPGSHYRFGSRDIDYEQLGAWCRMLPGQVMVREQLGADWLPFERVGTVHGQRGKSTEVAWFSDERDRPSWRQPELWP